MVYLIDSHFSMSVGLFASERHVHKLGDILNARRLHSNKGLVCLSAGYFRYTLFLLFLFVCMFVCWFVCLIIITK